MTRTHPPTLLTSLAACLQRECGKLDGEGVAAAVSGGPDSMALLHGLAAHREKFGYRLVALGIDHGLRPEAANELDGAARLAERLEVPFHRERLEVARGGNLQARARAARYEALRRLATERCGPGALLATAHHLEDRAETVLLRLLRGTSLAGLGVLAPRSGDLLRPLVRTPRARIFEHLERHQIEFARDPSNEDPRFSRVRVRKELVPLLEELSPSIAVHLASLADEALRLDEPLGLAREEREQLRRALTEPSLRVDLLLGHGLRLFREPNAARK